MDLMQKHCVPCEIGTPPMAEEDEDRYLKEVQGWALLREGTHKLKKQFKFKDFKGSMDFVNRIAAIAEAEGHHPDIGIIYNRVNIELFTHNAKGLSENDFIMASKIDALLL